MKYYLYALKLYLQTFVVTVAIEHRAQPTPVLEITFVLPHDFWHDSWCALCTLSFFFFFFYPRFFFLSFSHRQDSGTDLYLGGSAALIPGGIRPGAG